MKNNNSAAGLLVILFVFAALAWLFSQLPPEQQKRLAEGLSTTPAEIQADPDNPSTQRSMTREEYEQAGGTW